MDELHQHLLFQHDLGLYILGFVIVLTFLGMLLTFGAMYLIWGSRREMREEIQKSRESSERISYYLFGKLGPLDMK